MPDVLTRRDFLKLAAATVGAGFLSSCNIDPERFTAEQPTIEVRPDDILFTSSDIELRASSINGIVDIYDKNRQLVNNLVLLTGWTDGDGNQHFNNSEIQNTPILVSLENGQPVLTYKFQNNETLPAQQPASEVVLKVKFSNNGRSVNIETAVIENPNNLDDLKIGVGCFFGINQGTASANVLNSSGDSNIEPRVDTGMAEGQLGSFENYQGYGFTLISCYSEMPDINLTLEATNTFPPGTIDIESRNVVYNSNHQNLYQRYLGETGEESWIEAGILYAQPNNPNPNFILSLIER